MVSDQKGHSSRHESGGSDEIALDGLTLSDDAQLNIGTGSDFVFQFDSTNSRFELVDNVNNSDILRLTNSGSFDIVNRNLDMGTNNIENVGTVDGVNVDSHASRHSQGGADEVSVTDLNGSSGTSGQFLQTDGSNLSFATVDTFSGNYSELTNVPEQVAFETGHTEWASGLSDEEVHRFSNPNGFDLKQLEMQIKGGGTADAELKARLEEINAPKDLIQTLTDSAVRIFSVAFTDGFLAVGSGDNNVYVYDTSNFSLQETLTDSSNSVNSVGFSDDGSLLATGENFDGNNVYVYDTSNFSLQETLTDNSSSVNSVVFSANGNYLAAAGNDDVVYVYDTSNFSLQETLTDSTSNIKSIDFSSNYLAVGSADNNVYVYDTSNFSLQETLSDSTDNRVNCVGFSNDGSYLAVGTEFTENDVLIYDTSNFSLQETLTDSTDIVDSVAFTDGFLAVGSDDNNVYVYDTSNFSLQETLTDSTDLVNSVAFSSEGFLAVGSQDNNAYVYEEEIIPDISVSAGNSDSTGYTIDKDPVVIRLTTNETVDASLIVRGEKK